MKNITIIGSTGMIGTPVTKEIIKAGFNVTLLVRNIDKAKEIFGENVTYILGDLENLESLNQSMQNADAIYINISTTAEHKENQFNPEVIGLNNILEMAKKNGVKQVAYLSSFIARNYKGNWWVMNAKKSGIEKLKNSGIPYTIFYPSNFMENFENGMIDGNKINTIGKSVNKAWWISGEDFGKQVANALKSENSLNKEYPVQGLESFTMMEAAKVYAKNYNKAQLKVANLPLGLAKFLAHFVKPLKFVVPLMEVINNNVETFEAQKTWDELGKPQISLAEFAKK